MGEHLTRSHIRWTSALDVVKFVLNGPMDGETNNTILGVGYSKLYAQFHCLTLEQQHVYRIRLRKLVMKGLVKNVLTRVCLSALHLSPAMFTDHVFHIANCSKVQTHVFLYYILEV